MKLHIYDKIGYSLITVGFLLMIPFLIKETGTYAIAVSSFIGILAIFSGGVFLSQNKTSKIYKVTSPAISAVAIGLMFLTFGVIIFTYFIIPLIK